MLQHRHKIDLYVNIINYKFLRLLPGKMKNLPIEAIERRFKAGLRNIKRLYRPLVEEWQRIDDDGSIPRLLSEGDRA